MIEAKARVDEVTRASYGRLLALLSAPTRDIAAAEDALADAVEGAHAAERWIGLCGELGARPLAAPLLLGLGFDEVSVSPPRVLRAKAAFARVVLRLRAAWFVRPMFDLI